MTVPPFDEHVEAERLRQVAALIQELLREFDVVGQVYLAGRGGRFESFTHLSATWSNLRLEGEGTQRGLRLRSKLADYAGDVERQKREQEWSVGVVSGFANAMGVDALGWLEVASLFDKRTGATHTPFRRDDPRDPKARP